MEGSVSRRKNRKKHELCHKGITYLENFKYPSDCRVGMGLGGIRVWRVWTGKTIQGKISKGCKWHFRDIKVSTTGKKKIE